MANGVAAQTGGGSSFTRRTPLRQRMAAAVTRFLTSDPWRLVVFLAVLPLAVGTALTWAFRSGESVWLDIGTGLIGGSVIGLVFALVQHTLDSSAADRQAAEEVRFTVSSTMHLEGIDLREKDLQGSYLRNKVLDSARLDDAVLDGVDLQGARLKGARLPGASLEGADLSRADLSDADLHHAVLRDSTLRGTDLDGARLVDTDLSGARLTGVLHAGGAVLARSRLDGADLSDGCFTHAGMGDGASAPGGMLAPFLHGRNLDAEAADLRGVDLSDADLRGACFTAADLRGADLSGSDLTDAVLARADLRGTRLIGALLDNADLMGVVVDGTTVVDRAALDAAHHLPPDLPVDQAQRQCRTPLPIERVHLSGRGVSDEVLDAVADVLRRRRQELDRRNTDIETIVSTDGPPWWGSAANHGLPERVSRRGALLGEDVTIELTAASEGIRIVVAAPPEHVDPGRDVVVDAGAAPTTIAAAVQACLADGSGLQSLAGAMAMAEVLDAPSADLVAAATSVQRAARTEPTSPVALLLSAWTAESSDVEAMERAIDDLHVAWAGLDERIARAVTATRMASVRCQVLHRSTSAQARRLLESARAAADVALELLLTDLQPGARVDPLRLALLSRAGHSRAFTDNVQEDRLGLERAIRRYQDIIEDVVGSGLPVSPTTRNNLGYCAMALAGRFTRGPQEELYEEAARQFDAVLAGCGLAPIAPDGGAATSGPTDTSWLDGIRGLAARQPRTEGVEVDPPLRARAVRLALANRGNLYRLHKQWEAALACYGAALYLLPSYIEAYAERAWVHAERPSDATLPPAEDQPHLLRSGGLDEDVRSAIRAPEGSSAQKARAVLGVCQALRRVGRVDEIPPLLAQIQSLDPGNEGAAALAGQLGLDEARRRDDAQPLPVGTAGKQEERADVDH